RLKDEKIQKLFIEIWNEKMDFKQVLFKQIPREKNQLADSLANQAFGGGLL
ncbi:reverse transcriptase-like protein, partial [Patescibacteria group bacterium]|nr:reverse transcriptase-like protein [Patescibacteria group bacterium]